MRIYDILKKIDMFGVPVQLKYGGKNSYKSIIGGITTLIVYSLSLAYAIMIIYQWANNELLPKVQTYIQTIHQGKITLPSEFMTVAFFNSTVSAFNQSSCLMLPLLVEMHQNEFRNYKPIFEKVGSGSTTTSELQIQLPQLSVSTQDFNNVNEPNFQQYFLLLTPCTPFLSAQYNYTCAPEADIQEFIKNAPPVLEVKMQVSQYNSGERQNQIIAQSHYAVFQPDSGYYESIVFRSQLQQVDSGMLMQNFAESTHVSSFIVMSQQISLPQTQKIFGMVTYAAFFIQMDNLQDGLTVVEIKLSEILAMIGSITAMLLMVGNIITTLNNYLLDQEICVNLLKFYSINNIKLEKGLIKGFNKIQGDQVFDKSTSTKIQKKLLGELNILNILYNLNQINKRLEINSDQYSFEALLRALDYEKPDEEMILKSDNGAHTPQPSEENKATPALTLQYSKQKKLLESQVIK